MRHLKQAIFVSACVKLLLSIWVEILLLSLSGDVEMNPDLRRNFDAAFSICHWNLNSIAAHNYAKLSLLKTCISIYSFDVIYMHF